MAGSTVANLPKTLTQGGSTAIALPFGQNRNRDLTGPYQGISMGITGTLPLLSRIDDQSLSVRAPLTGHCGRLDRVESTFGLNFLSRKTELFNRIDPLRPVDTLRVQWQLTEQRRRLWSVIKPRLIEADNCVSADQVGYAMRTCRSADPGHPPNYICGTDVGLKFNIYSDTLSCRKAWLIVSGFLRPR